MLRPLGVLALMVVLALATPARAEEPSYPSRAVKIIVSAPPGGGVDIVARVIADRLAKLWGQPFVVENRPGAGGNLGSESVAAAEPDGYTLLAAQPAPLTTNVVLYKKLNFDPAALEPLAIMTSIPNTLVVRTDFPANSVQELIAYAKANPGKVNFGSQGVGTTPHLTGELFARLTGTKLTHVPYRGTAQAVNDLIAGHLDLLFFQLDSVREQVQAKRAKMLAVTTPERVPAMPEVPTMDEAGVKGFRSDTWNALAAPPKTPPAIVAKLNAGINEVLKQPDTAEHLRGMNMTPIGGAPDGIKAFIKDETERWGDVIRAAKITADYAERVASRVPAKRAPRCIGGARWRARARAGTQCNAATSRGSFLFWPLGPGSRFSRPGHERANSRRAKRTVGHGLKLTMSNSAVFFLPAARLCAPGLSVLFAPALPEASV
jgi:tripartite-type tricarboxylate transporter receptor subunit TctC